MIDEVEVGKRYRLIDKEGYLNCGESGSDNARLIEHGYFDPDGCVVIDTVDYDGEGWFDGVLVILRSEFPFFELVEENTEMETPKEITPETEVTVTTTYGELARFYYCVGNANGKVHGESLWSIVGNLLGDSSSSIYFANEPKHQLIDYRSVQEEWELLFFKSKKQQEKELVIKEKRAVIAKLEKEIKELEGE